MIKDEEQIVHKDFTGLRNNVAAGEFDRSDLEVALNVEINDRRIIQRRKGFGAAVVEGAYHSLWAGAGVCLAVSGSDLVRIAPGYATTSLRTDLAANRPCSYASVGGRVFYSNGLQTGIVENGASRTWGIEPPDRLAASQIGGSFRAGRYQFVMTYLRNDGQESGASLAGQLELSTTGGFRFSDLPVSTDPSVIGKVIYLSTWNGVLLYQAASILNADTTCNIVDPVPASYPLQTQHLLPAPAGDIVSHHNGRMLVASGSLLHPSVAYSLELFDRREVIQFESRINAVAPVTGGVFVGTEHQIVFLAGADVVSATYDVKATYGAIFGTLAEAQADTIGEGTSGKSFALASKQGMCVLGDGGAFKNLTQERFSYPVTAAGGGLVRKHRGMNQYVAVLRGGTETAANQHI